MIEFIAMIAYIICFWQAGLIEAPNVDDSCVFTKSKHILFDYQKLKRMSVADLKDLIQQV